MLVQASVGWIEIKKSENVSTHFLAYVFDK